VYRHLVIATDGSEPAEKAVRHALELAKELKARVTAVLVTEPLTALMTGENAIAFPIEDYEKAADESAAKILGAVAEAAKVNGVSCDTIHMKNSYPAEGILETAKTKGADLIVMGSHGRRGLSKFLLGSQATEVVSLSTIPVLVCR
jgi:nucleotide-binding universal stress UspA family protein